MRPQKWMGKSGRGISGQTGQNGGMYIKKKKKNTTKNVYKAEEVEKGTIGNSQRPIKSGPLLPLLTWGTPLLTLTKATNCNIWIILNETEYYLAYYWMRMNYGLSLYYGQYFCSDILLWIVFHWFYQYNKVILYSTKQYDNTINQRCFDRRDEQNFVCTIFSSNISSHPLSSHFHALMSRGSCFNGFAHFCSCLQHRLFPLEFHCFPADLNVRWLFPGCNLQTRGLSYLAPVQGNIRG